MERQTEKWDSTNPPGHWLASQHLGEATSKTDFRIDGWLAAKGTSVWFGPGSTGKTQLLLWMASMIASTARPAQWLGREVHGTGHVLILSAEDWLVHRCHCLATSGHEAVNAADERRSVFRGLRSGGDQRIPRTRCLERAARLEPWHCAGH